jgi:hypothetical protein
MVSTMVEGCVLVVLSGREIFVSGGKSRGLDGGSTIFLKSFEGFVWNNVSFFRARS